MTDIEIAQNAAPQPIAQLAAETLGLSPDCLIPFGHLKAKVDLGKVDNAHPVSEAKLVLVTAISPTPAGEGKTTTTIGLGDGLRSIGQNAMVCLREPSLGPSFGMKGGATGGGYSQVIPMEDINLHFTGDFHAITAANNLLSAMIDNHLHWGNNLNLDPRRLTWKRVLDCNDRALRQVVTGLGDGNGLAAESGFDITVASEVMAIFCLSENLADLKRRLTRIVIGQNTSGEDVTAGDLKAAGAMATLLKDSLTPNLVQTIEGSPAFIHGGPFANIAHGCNSVIATKAAMSLSDIVVTEAGFGADLGAEKFFNIKCRKSGLSPDLAVVVATVRALKYHGGAERKSLGEENLEALECGFANLKRHLENIGKFRVPAIVALNAFDSDTGEEKQKVIELCESIGVRCVLATHWADGSSGAKELAELVVDTLEANPESQFSTLYPDTDTPEEKLRIVAKEIYRADDIALSKIAKRKLAGLEGTEAAGFPVCIAKTPYSFSSDPLALGAATGFSLPIRDIRVSAGAGFIVALSGDIMTMPGLPRKPAGEVIDVDGEGKITGLS